MKTKMIERTLLLTLLLSAFCMQIYASIWASKFNICVEIFLTPDPRHYGASAYEFASSNVSNFVDRTGLSPKFNPEEYYKELKVFFPSDKNISLLPSLSELHVHHQTLLSQFKASPFYEKAVPHSNILRSIHKTNNLLAKRHLTQLEYDFQKPALITKSFFGYMELSFAARVNDKNVIFSMSDARLWSMGFDAKMMPGDIRTNCMGDVLQPDLEHFFGHNAEEHGFINLLPGRSSLFGNYRSLKTYIHERFVQIPYEQSTNLDLMLAMDKSKRAVHAATLLNKTESMERAWLGEKCGGSLRSVRTLNEMLKEFHETETVGFYRPAIRERNLSVSRAFVSIR